MKSAKLWFLKHALRILGLVLVVLAAVGVLTGQLSIDAASIVVVGGLGMFGISVKFDQVHAVLAAGSAAGSAYRAGDTSAAVRELQPVATELLVAAAKAPLTMTLAGETQDVLAAASALQAKSVAVSSPAVTDAEVACAVREVYTATSQREAV